MQIILLDLFSGIGGFHEGLCRAGFTIEKTYFSELDKHAIANYKYNHEGAEYVGSVADIRGTDLGEVDAITFGSPCQDFSIAGNRSGMDGERSSLISEAIRLVDECRPKFFIWENVKGTFSSNAGEDFWAIIKAFSELGGYRLEWQLLNTSWFLPQNRERIYLVGVASEARRGGGDVFPIREKTKRTIKGPGKTKITGCLTAGGNSGGLHSSMTLIKQKGRGYNKGGFLKTCPTITSSRFEKNNHVCTVAKNLQGKNHINTIRSGGRGSLTNKHNWDCVKVGTFRTHKDGMGFRETKSGKCPTIPAIAREDGSSQPCISIKPVLTPNRINKRQNGRRFKDDGDSSFTLTTQDKHGIQIDEERIRRLTKIECERLQGYPDNYTKYGIYDGVTKKISATQRYKMIGNSVTVDVVEQVGINIRAIVGASQLDTSDYAGSARCKNVLSR